MSRDGSLNDLIKEQNGRKTLIQKITVGTSGTITSLSTTDINGATVPQGAALMLQADQDFFYELRETGATTAVTNHAGARPGVHVPAFSQEFVIPHVGPTTAAGQKADKQLDLVAMGAGTNVSVFWVV